MTATASDDRDGYRHARRDLFDTLDALIRRSTETLNSPRFTYNALVNGTGGELIRAARRGRVEAEDAVTYAVLVERATGKSWEQIAEWLREDEGFVTEHYGAIEVEYQRTGRIRPGLGDVTV